MSDYFGGGLVAEFVIGYLWVVGLSVALFSLNHFYPFAELLNRCLVALIVKLRPEAFENLVVVQSSPYRLPEKSIKSRPVQPSASWKILKPLILDWLKEKYINSQIRRSFKELPLAPIATISYLLMTGLVIFHWTPFLFSESARTIHAYVFDWERVRYLEFVLPFSLSTAWDVLIAPVVVAIIVLWRWRLNRYQNGIMPFSPMQRLFVDSGLILWLIINNHGLSWPGQYSSIAINNLVIFVSGGVVLPSICLIYIAEFGVLIWEDCQIDKSKNILKNLPGIKQGWLLFGFIFLVLSLDGLIHSSLLIGAIAGLLIGTAFGVLLASVIAVSSLIGRLVSRMWCRE